MDYPKGLFTLHVTEGTAITPSDIRKAVRTKFEIPSIEIVGMAGKIRKTAASVRFEPIGQKAIFLLEDVKSEKEEKREKIVANLPDGETFLISGKLIERAGKKKTELVIEVAMAKKPKKESEQPEEGSEKPN